MCVLSLTLFAGELREVDMSSIWECAKCAKRMSNGEPVCMCPGCDSCGPGCGGSRQHVGLEVIDGQVVRKRKAYVWTLEDDEQALDSAPIIDPHVDSHPSIIEADDKQFGPNDRVEIPQHCLTRKWTHCQECEPTWDQPSIRHRACILLRELTQKVSLWLFQGIRRPLQKRNTEAIPYDPILCGHTVQDQMYATIPFDELYCRPIIDGLHPKSATELCNYDTIPLDELDSTGWKHRLDDTIPLDELNSQGWKHRIVLTTEQQDLLREALTLTSGSDPINPMQAMPLQCRQECAAKFIKKHAAQFDDSRVAIEAQQPQLRAERRAIEDASRAEERTAMEEASTR